MRQFFDKIWTLALLLCLTAQSGQLQAAHNKYSFVAQNLPGYWLESLDRINKRDIMQNLQADCKERQLQYAKISRYSTIWLRNIDVNPKIFPKNREKALLGSLNMFLEKHKIKKTLTGVPVNIVFVPRPDSIPWLSHMNSDSPDIRRPGFIERLYLPVLSGMCLTPMIFDEDDQMRGKHYVASIGLQIGPVSAAQVYMSPKLLLPAFAIAYPDQMRTDDRAPKSESVALVNTENEIVGINCFVSNSRKFTAVDSREATEQCFDIIESARSVSPAPTRRYFDEQH